VNFGFPNLTHLTPDPTAQPERVSHLIIRAASQRDLSSLAQILADSFHPQNGILRWAYPLLRLGIYEDLRSRLRSISPHTICLVAVAASSNEAGASEYIAGTVEMALRSPSYWQPKVREYPYISNLAVRRSFRRQGVAMQLLHSCEQTAIEWGFGDLYLHVLENNHQARQLYLKTGYQLHQVDRSFGSCVLGQPRRLFLRKYLTPGSTV